MAGPDHPGLVGQFLRLDPVANGEGMRLRRRRSSSMSRPSCRRATCPPEGRPEGRCRLGRIPGRRGTPVAQSNGLGALPARRRRCPSPRRRRGAAPVPGRLADRFRSSSHPAPRDRAERPSWPRWVPRMCRCSWETPSCKLLTAQSHKWAGCVRSRAPPALVEIAGQPFADRPLGGQPAGTSRTPSCWKNSRLSVLAQYSASLPSAMRRMSVPVKLTCRPMASVGAPGKPPR